MPQIQAPTERLETLWAMQPEAFSAFMADEECARRWQTMLDREPEDTPPYELAEGGVAIIPVEGVIMRRSLWFGAGLKDIAAALDAALADPAVRAILFSVDSPGGQARGVKEVADAINAARRVKPCAAFVDGLAASAAYWLASATGAIYAGPSAEVGSIGVILRHMDKSGWNKEVGLAFTYITAGAYKAIGNPDSALSERDLSVLQARVDAIYDMFCGDVAQHMGLALENRAAWADGRDFLAEAACALGLVTAIVPDRASAIKHLVKETRMDKTQLERDHPALVAELRQEAAEAVRRELDAEASKSAAAAVDNALQLLATVCGQETADKVGALVKSGLTPDQLSAAAAALTVGAAAAMPAAASGAAGNTNAEILDAIKAATPQPVKDGAAPADEETAMIQRIGNMQ